MNHRLDYCKRTLEHIHRVHFNMLHLISNLEPQFFKRNRLDTRELMLQVMHHDISKFNDVQFFAYSDYFNGTQPPNEYTKAEFNLAWENHKHNENHHYEGQRYMRPGQIVEMVCDWQSMAQEFNEGSCRKYYEERFKPEYLKHFRECNFSQSYSGNYSDDFEFALFERIIEDCITCFEIIKKE